MPLLGLLEVILAVAAIILVPGWGVVGISAFAIYFIVGWVGWDGLQRLAGNR